MVSVTDGRREERRGGGERGSDSHIGEETMAPGLLQLWGQLCRVCGQPSQSILWRRDAPAAVPAMPRKWACENRKGRCEKGLGP
eukprot:4499702-Prorocentrum_lima.AAC.1